MGGKINPKAENAGVTIKLLKEHWIQIPISRKSTLKPKYNTFYHKNYIFKPRTNCDKSLTDPFAQLAPTNNPKHMNNTPSQQLTQNQPPKPHKPMLETRKSPKGDKTRSPEIEQTSLLKIPM